MHGTVHPGLFALLSGRRFCETTRMAALHPHAHYPHGITAGRQRRHLISAQTDMAKAKSMRDLAKQIKDPTAKLDFEEAALRFEKKAAKGARRAGRIRRKKPAQTERR